MKTPTEIVNALLRRGFTQTHIAFLAGVSQATIHRIAHGADARSAVADRLRQQYQRLVCEAQSDDPQE